jgi:hypothetical protein
MRREPIDALAKHQFVPRIGLAGAQGADGG